LGCLPALESWWKSRKSRFVKSERLHFDCWTCFHCLQGVFAFPHPHTLICTPLLDGTVTGVASCATCSSITSTVVLRTSMPVDVLSAGGARLGVFPIIFISTVGPYLQGRCKPQMINTILGKVPEDKVGATHTSPLRRRPSNVTRRPKAATVTRNQISERETPDD
jgi:hypothetical protein